MTQKEITSFNTFREHCRKGETAIMIGADFVAMDKNSYKERIVKKEIYREIKTIFEGIKKDYGQNIQTKNFEEIVINRISDILSR